MSGTRLPGVNCKVGLQNVIQDLLLRGEAGHDFVYLSDNGTEEGGSTKEEKDAEDLQHGTHDRQRYSKRTGLFQQLRLTETEPTRSPCVVA